MATHMSIRLAWHNDGWNGHICKKPCENTYCIGPHSYPGGLISEERDLEYEETHAGAPICNHPCKVACSLSANAFGSEPIIAKIEPPDFWNGIGDPIQLKLPPYTACTWCYEEMYGPKVTDNGHFNYEKRLNFAKDYFSQFEENKSLIFYCSGFSNPFSEDDADCYVVTGISRIKKIDDFYFYDNTNDEIKKKYAGGFAWQKPITSNYPDEGFCIPYWKYMDNEDIINRLVIKPSNTSSFKYGSRAVKNDDAIEIVNQLIESVDVLIEIDDKTENWISRREWLNGLLNELWKARGPFPGFPSVLSVLKLDCLIQNYINLTTNEDMKRFYNEVCEFLNGKQEKVFDIDISDSKIIRREFQRLEEAEQKLLIEILPRFDITKNQIVTILSDKRANYSIISDIKDIVDNPYIICEEYIGLDSDDSIPFYKIDNGIISSPEYGLENILDSGSTERLRALCVDELKRIAAHSFGKAETIISFVNTRLDRMPEWKRYTYKVKDLTIEKEIIEKALFIRKDDNDELFIYLKTVYEDERTIESIFKQLAERPDIPLTMSISTEKFKEGLREPNSKIAEVAFSKYEYILEKQAETCFQIFRKPICVLSGAAGTGKTTVIKTLVENIKRVHGQGVGILLLAPTGKAAERIKNQTGEKSSTIHSYLASNGWINENFTLKRSGGKMGQDLNTLIIDESSMIDLNLFATLLRAINWNSIRRLILVGDPNQLPPIGKGKVFADTIAWLSKDYAQNIGTLTENIRQLRNQVEGNGTGILDLAELFIQENQKSDDTEKCNILKTHKEQLFTKILEKGNGPIDKDLSVYFWKEQNELDETLKKVLIKDMEDITGLREYKNNDGLWRKALQGEGETINPDSIQLISPYRGELYGTDALNSFMQSEFNSYWINKCENNGSTYFDKVIQFRNRPKSDMAYAYNFATRQTERKEIYNGEMGIVYYHPFDKKDNRHMYQKVIERFQVEFSSKSRKGLRYNYGKNLWKDSEGKYIPEQKVEENLELAYAISVHKSQGSEFDNVYIVIPKRDSHLLTMELLYTAITRAQKKVTLFLQDDIGTLTTLGHIEKSAIQKINSSVFEFKPLPEDILYINVCKWHEDSKKLATLSKYFVRSKSEVVITNLLVSESIPFEYETPLYAPDGTMYLPDFTVTFRGDTYYWEHVGMLDNPGYKAHWEKKEKWYEEHFPGKLIVTYEGADLTTKAKEIIDNNK